MFTANTIRNTVDIIVKQQIRVNYTFAVTRSCKISNDQELG